MDPGVEQGGINAASRPVTKHHLAATLRSVLRGAARDFEPPAEPCRAVLWLYVSATSIHSARARSIVDAVLADYDPEQVQLNIIDVAADGVLAERDGIIATPTLIKKFPAPTVWIAGSLDDDGTIVRRLLDSALVEKKQ